MSLKKPVSLLPAAAQLYDVHVELTRLVKIFGSNTLARILGVDPAMVSRWHKQTSPVSTDMRAKISHVDHAIGRLLQVLTPSSAESWLFGNNPWVNGRPIDALTLGKYDRVLEAIDAEESGAYF